MERGRQQNGSLADGYGGEMGEECTRPLDAGGSSGQMQQQRPRKPATARRYEAEARKTAWLSGER